MQHVRLREELELAIQCRGVQVDNGLHQNMCTIMAETCHLTLSLASFGASKSVDECKVNAVGDSNDKVFNFDGVM